MGAELQVQLHSVALDRRKAVVLGAPDSVPEPLRPTSLLRLSLLRLVDSKLPGKCSVDVRIPPLDIEIQKLESSPPKSRVLVFEDWPQSAAFGAGSDAERASRGVREEGRRQV